MILRNWFLSGRTNQSQQPARKLRAHIGVEQLEGREVPAVGLASALDLGNDAGISRAEDVAADAAGNSYLTGNFTGIVDFDPAQTHPGDTDILTSVGETDIFVAKYASDSSLMWAIRMGGSSPDAGGGTYDGGRAIDLDSNGNVYVTGQFVNTADFGSVSLTTAEGGKDGFVTKLSSAGSVLWAKNWGLSEGSQDSGYGETGMGVDTDAAGNVYVIGSRRPSTLTGYGYDILKYSENGSKQWAKFIPSNTAANSSCDLAVDLAGNVFTTAAFAGTVDFDPNQGTKNVNAGPGTAGFVLKLTAAGQFGWVSPFVSQAQTVNGSTTNGAAHGQSLTLDTSGSVIVGGYYYNKVDFNPGTGTTNLPMGGGGFITKLNSSGGLVWVKAIERDTTYASNSVFVYGLATDAARNIYATGSFRGAADFNPATSVTSRTSAGGSDIYVLKLTSTGSFDWVESFGGTGDDIGWGIAVDAAGTVHLAGGFSGTVDFDPDPTDLYFLSNPGSYSNGYLVRLNQF